MHNLAQNYFQTEMLRSCILIIEDDDLSRMVLSMVFRKHGFYNIHEAENGKIGLEKVNQYQPDLIITDIQMPEVDGFEVCRQIRANPNPEISRTPILVQTALKQAKDREMIFEAGATDYIAKPYDSKEIIVRSFVHLEREAVIKRLLGFNSRIAEESHHTMRKPKELMDSFWSFKALSGTINELLDQIEQSHGELVYAKNKAVRADQLKTEFLANVTHELKTPVHCITSYAQMGLADPEIINFTAGKELFTDIHDNGVRLNVLISDLIDISKIESGNMELSLQPCSVQNIIKNAIKFTRGVDNKKNLHIIADNLVGDDKIMVDERKMEQVFINLLANAIRFSPDNGLITFGCSPSIITIPGDISVPALSITIQDEGPGILEEEFEHVFDPFVHDRSKSGTPKQGTGLGLTITRSILQLFYGTIHVNNVPGNKGAIFEITLPLHPVEPNIGIIQNTP